MGAVTLEEVVLFALAIIFPPLGVLLAVGCGFHFCLSIILTLFGFIPGVVHAFYVLVVTRNAAAGGKKKKSG